MYIHINFCCCLLVSVKMISATLTDLKEVTYYEFVDVRHIDAHGRNRRDLSTYEGDKHIEETSYTFNGHGRRFHLQLYKNEILFHPSFSVSYQHSDGTSRRHNNRDHCFYHGHVTGRNRSSVVVNTCYGLSGVVIDDDDSEFIIQPFPPSTSKRTIPKSYILYKSDDVLNDDVNSECGVYHKHDVIQDAPTSEKMNSDDEIESSRYSLNDRGASESHSEERRSDSNSHNRSRRSTKADEYTKYIETVVVLDKLFLRQFNDDTEKAQHRALEIFNIVDSKFKTVKTRVAVVNIVLWNVFNMARVSSSQQETLHYFARYTRDVLRYEMGLRFDNAQLLTTQSWGSVVGYAGIGVLCSSRSSAINRDRKNRPAVGTACIVTHEIGHNIGFRHNTDTCTCDTPPCVMNSMSVGNCKGFTDCSKRQYSDRLQQDHLPCMLDLPHDLYGEGWCGNGWVEEGEACDCGTAEECATLGADKCCNSTSCQLHTHAQCASGPCCEGCRFKSRGVLCRDRMNRDCDLPEYCTGTSQNCPQNFHVVDGEPCDGGSGYCYDGSCNTHTKQCESSKKTFRVSSGDTAVQASDSCYRDRNTRGNSYGNCGKDARGDFVPCRAENALCGKLQCDFGSNKCVWMQAQGSQEEQDPTMTYAGMKCGPGRLCVDQQCVNISSLTHIKTCSKTCINAGGVCNNNGNCHCPVGRACPYCELAGPGGSADSGQGCILHDSCEDCFTPLAKAMLVIFLLILPLGVILFLVYRNRDVIRERIFGRRQFSVPTRQSGFDQEVVANKEAGNGARILNPVAGQPPGSSRPPLPSRPARAPPPSRPPRPPASVQT